jgi:crotonobetainyl-CoA:carnitine CoA-transferase CaiB-like acyl-CoA transferase
LYGPSDVFPTSDGFIFVQVIGRSTFERWARLVGEEGWLEDARFETNEGRGIHASALADRMTEWCAGRSTDAALDDLDKARIPAGPVLSPQQCLDHPQFAAADVFTLTENPAIASPVPVATWPVRLAHGGVDVTRRAPAIGEHTDGILAELGYSASAIANLLDRSVVACRGTQGVRV